eukprot:2181832-Pyramimonas_sp.AAC.1
MLDLIAVGGPPPALPAHGAAHDCVIARQLSRRLSEDIKLQRLARQHTRQKGPLAGAVELRRPLIAADLQLSLPPRAVELDSLRARAALALPAARGGGGWRGAPPAPPGRRQPSTGVGLHMLARPPSSMRRLPCCMASACSMPNSTRRLSCCAWCASMTASLAWRSRIMHCPTWASCWPSSAVHIASEACACWARTSASPSSSDWVWWQRSRSRRAICRRSTSPRRALFAASASARIS